MITSHLSNQNNNDNNNMHSPSILSRLAVLFDVVIRLNVAFLTVYRREIRSDSSVVLPDYPKRFLFIYFCFDLWRQQNIDSHCRYSVITRIKQSRVKIITKVMVSSIVGRSLQIYVAPSVFHRSIYNKKGLYVAIDVYFFGYLEVL